MSYSSACTSGEIVFDLLWLRLSWWALIVKHSNVFVSKLKIKGARISLLLNRPKRSDSSRVTRRNGFGYPIFTFNTFIIFLPISFSMDDEHHVHSKSTRNNHSCCIFSGTRTSFVILVWCVCCLTNWNELVLGYGYSLKNRGHQACN